MLRRSKSSPTDESELADLARAAGLSLESAASLGRAISDTAFDEFVFDPLSLAGSGAVLERGINSAGTVLAVGSVLWPDMPIGWTALQSRDGANHLALIDEMEPVGHTIFDEAFAVDADDPSAFRRMFRSSLREWIVDFDSRHGPLTIVFDGDISDQSKTHIPALFVAREVLGDAAFTETLTITADLAEHIRDALYR